MLRIKLICVGRIKEAFYTQAVSEYSKRLQRYCKLEITELNDEKTPDNASDAENERIKEKEGNRILEAIPDGSYVIALAIEGKMPDSVELSKKLESLGVDGFGHVTFIIGGSLGLDRRVLDRADYRLSFSKMTFPHQLMRVILLEQIYRGFRIMNNEPYHK